MKRILTILAAVMALTLTAAAQRPMVTLSHDGQLSFFTSLSALQEALDSAQNGDIIYLSEGKFASNSSDITIDKRLSIVGCGYKSHILANLKIDMERNTAYMDAPLFDGVRMQTLDFSGIAASRTNLNNVDIKKCWIRELSRGGYAGKNFNIDRCYIETAEFTGATSNNTVLQNTKIETIDNTSDNYAIQVMNCNIHKAFWCPKIVISSIINEGGTSTGNGIGSWYYLKPNGSHIIYNSLLGSQRMLQDINGTIKNITTYDCFYDNGGETGLFDDKLDCTINLEEKGYFGEDGTVVGVYGGEFPYSETPTVPTVDSAKSSVEYDKDSNQLNVTITVAPN